MHEQTTTRRHGFKAHLRQGGAEFQSVQLPFPSLIDHVPDLHLDDVVGRLETPLDACHLSNVGRNPFVGIGSVTKIHQKSFELKTDNYPLYI